MYIYKFSIHFENGESNSFEVSLNTQNYKEYFSLFKNDMKGILSVYVHQLIKENDKIIHIPLGYL
jgi:hypothetical protein